MDRRAFLKSLLAAGTLVAINPELALEQCLTETEKLTDSEFITYITWTMNIYMHNPAHCFIMTGIGEEE